MIINAFNDVKRAELPVKQGIAGSPYLDNLLALQIGHGSVTMKSNKQGLWLGAKNYQSAPFYVDMNGNVVATSISLGGAYIATGGAAADVNANATLVSGTKLVSLSITSTQIADNAISTPKLQANSVTANEIAANSVTATKISVSTLSAISADMGSITAGTITGATIRTASSGARFEISGTKAASYNSSNTELTRLDGDGLGIFGTSGNTIKFKDTASGTEYGQMSYNSSLPAMYLTSSGTNLVLLNSSGSHDLLLGSSRDTFIDADSDLYLSAGTGEVHVTDTLRVVSINFNEGVSEGSISNIDTISGYNDINFQLGGNNDFFFKDSGGNVNARINYTGKIFSDDTNINLNGADKSAIMKTFEGYNALYCIESPEVWFMDFVSSKNPYLEDPLFTDVTIGTRMYIECVNDQGERSYQVWRKRRGHSQKRFESKTEAQFIKNEQFLRMPK